MYASGSMIMLSCRLQLYFQIFTAVFHRLLEILIAEVILLKSSFSGSKLSRAIGNARYITGQGGIQENPDASPRKKRRHTIEAPKISSQHF